jgi:hypothetical protein
LHCSRGRTIPPALNAILPKISAGMKPEEVKKLLAVKYPKVEYHLGVWSGQTGYFDFKLDDRWTLSVAGETDRSKGSIVHHDGLIYLFDRANKNRVEIKRYSWKE